MGILIWVFSMHSENGRISRKASPIKSAHSEQCVMSKCYPCSIQVNREMTKPLMVDHCNTFTSRNCPRFPIFGKLFGRKLTRTNTQKIQRNYQNFFLILNLLD